MDSETAPCPHCRVRISIEASVCPQCRHGVCVVVRLGEPMADGRARYRVGRSLAALGEGVPAFPDVQARLQTPGIVVGPVTVALAQRVVVILEEAGVAPKIELAGRAAEAKEDEPAGRRWIVLWGASAAVALAALGWAVLGRRAAEPPAPAPSAGAAAGTLTPPATLSPTQLAERALPATVSLQCMDQLGSGFFVDQELLITNAHVLCPGDASIRVRFQDGHEVSGTVVRSDEALDLAVVRASGLHAAPLPIGDAGALKVGQRLTIIGCPVGMEFTVSQAAASNLERVEFGVAYIQIDAAVNPGNSGGPLVDETGRVVGVVTLKRKDAEGIGLALPINYVYAGTQPLLAAARPPSAGFERMAKRAEEESQKMAGELASAGQLPGLIAAAPAGNMLLARILWPSSNDPGPKTFNFSLWHDTEQICAFAGEVSAWVRVEGKDGTSPLPPRAKAWLERNGFSSTLYLGQAVMRWDNCPTEKLSGSVEMQMEGADSGASRLKLQ